MAENTNFSGGKKQKTVALFTESMEAWVVNGYDNNRDKWAARAEYYKKHGDYKYTLPDRKPKTEPDVLWDAKYSSSSNGNCPFGSWSDEGLNNFKELMEEIKTARKDKDTFKAMIEKEKEFLKILQDGQKKDGSATTTTRGKKRKAGQDTVAVEAEKASTGEEDLDEDIFE